MSCDNGRQSPDPQGGASRAISRPAGRPQSSPLELLIVDMVDRVMNLRDGDARRIGLTALVDVLCAGASPDLAAQSIDLTARPAPHSECGSRGSLRS